MITRVRQRPAAVALLLVALVAVVLLTDHGGTHEVTAVFRQANGLVTGGDVKAGGVRVGHIIAIDLGDDGLPHVKMEIDNDFAVRAGAHADVRFTSVAGEINRYVALTAGTGAPVADHAEIPVARTDNPVEIDQVLSTLDPATRRDVRSVLRDVDAATRRRGPLIERTLSRSADALEQVTEVVRQIRGDGDTLRQVVQDGHTTLTALAADPGGLGATVTQLAETLRTTGARQRELTQITARLAPGLRAPTRALETADRASGRLRALVAELRPSVAELPGFAADLQPALHAGRPALASARALVTSAPAELRRVLPLLRTAKPVLHTLDPVLRDTAPMLDQLRTRLPDAFAFLSGWADFGSNYDANGHLARVGLVFPPAPVNTIGPSDPGAGQLSPPFLRTPGVLEGEPWTTFEQSFVGGTP
ncbi:MlaD family protein [Paraconexibacter antarcticus]|uniref:MlaD family protein n=1 Tax=Paraconexibacter antarcticus TaxID=2949664 RepID=A0ABY5DZ96_9ACTN|nr:MlaD family protein [Paraconexibacter antarcticus]UTI66865.1 MlaD family protein [Paraconexibacter antarcticus]